MRLLQRDIFYFDGYQLDKKNSITSTINTDYLSNVGPLLYMTDCSVMVQHKHDGHDITLLALISISFSSWVLCARDLKLSLL